MAVSIQSLVYDPSLVYTDLQPHNSVLSAAKGLAVNDVMRIVAELKCAFSFREIFINYF